MFKRGYYTMKKSLLAVDIGAGTQDILLYEEGIPVENCVKLVLPSQTRIVAARIARETAAGKAICLCGRLMGGGPLVRALKLHLAAGLQVFALADPARTIRDDLQEVEAMGVRIITTPPAWSTCIYLQDLDLPKLREALAGFDVPLPEMVAVAVQDHGEAIGYSNRKFRFEHWERFLADGGFLDRLIYRDQIPGYLTRMLSVQQSAPGAYLMDTGAAAIRGALIDPVVGAKQQQGVLVVNVGNQHTLAALVKGQRIWGIFEHHTGLLTSDSLRDYLQRFVRRQVTNEEVYADSGHGCAICPDAPEAEDFDFVAVTGPRRSLAQGMGYFAVPGGDMMISGCFGLVAAVMEQCRVTG
jgi:uncharacterized protein (DUF1786 family)